MVDAQVRNLVEEADEDPDPRALPARGVLTTANLIPERLSDVDRPLQE
jgi:hypothetical protein